AKKPDREGLPPGYRMRADAHYVEHLTARRGDKAVPDAAARFPSELPDRQEARDRTERLFTQLSEDIATIESAIAALAGDASRMARRVNADLIKSEVWRAGW